MVAKKTVDRAKSSHISFNLYIDNGTMNNKLYTESYYWKTKHNLISL